MLLGLSTGGALQQGTVTKRCTRCALEEGTSDALGVKVGDTIQLHRQDRKNNIWQSWIVDPRGMAILLLTTTGVRIPDAELWPWPPKKGRCRQRTAISSSDEAMSSIKKPISSQAEKLVGGQLSRVVE